MAGEPFTTEDIGPFLTLAFEEGWICDRWEFEFLLQTFPKGCLVWREKGIPAGFVTSVRYGTSGWVGNLLVDRKHRRKGIGRVLIEQAVGELLRDGAKTVWLTASTDGAGLYRKLGFLAIDSIWRWSGRGAVREMPQVPGLDLESVHWIDRGGWGDKRESLLKVSLDRGTLFTTSGGFICCQRWKNGIQIGPWGSLIESQAQQLIADALTEGKEQIFLDVPAGNRTANALLEQMGFGVKGTNLLMYLGVEPRYKPENIYALASMGSMG